jgi:predicted alpha/beta-hydrolase family hydrolase
MQRIDTTHGSTNPRAAPAPRRNGGRGELRRLGPIEGRDVLVVVGRNNASRRSASLEALLLALHHRGLSICWYQSPIAQLRNVIDGAVRSRLPQSLAASYLDASPLRSLLRWLLKTAYLLPRPHRWWYFAHAGEERFHTSPAALQRFVGTLGARRVFVLTQSAGGIAASLIANDAPVDRLICFGYPFKHPDRTEEPRRTAHLADLRKPCLILQGDRDDYGSRADTARYRLSPSIRVESIDASHDYDALSSGDFHRCLCLIAEHLDLAPQGPSHLDDRAWAS